MLILGGKYDSTENKQKSYTYLEYEYAINKNIFILVVILNEQFPIKTLILSDEVYEKGNITLYNDFKKIGYV